MPTSPRGGTGKDGWELIGGHASVSVCSEHWTIQSNHKLKPVLQCTVWSQCTPLLTDGRTYGSSVQYGGAMQMDGSHSLPP